MRSADEFITGFYTLERSPESSGKDSQSILSAILGGAGVAGLRRVTFVFTEATDHYSDPGPLSRNELRSESLNGVQRTLETLNARVHLAERADCEATGSVEPNRVSVRLSDKLWCANCGRYFGKKATTDTASAKSRRHSYVTDTRSPGDREFNSDDARDSVISNEGK
jgi:hypothetical protein